MELKKMEENRKGFAALWDDTQAPQALTADTMVNVNSREGE